MKGPLPTLVVILLLSAPLLSLGQGGDTVTVARPFNKTDTVYVFTKAQRDSIRAIVAQNFTIGDFTPGKGYEIAHGKYGTVNFSAYALMRYTNQLPDSKTYTDHLGRVKTLDPRNDIQWHRSYLYFNGW